MEKYRICVACASGMATSHLIMDQLKDLLVILYHNIGRPVKTEAQDMPIFV